MKRAAGVLCVMLAVCGAARAGEPVPAAIETLLASPYDFDGKTVLVRGQVDNCMSLTCNLCPEAMTDKSFDRDECLGLEFGNLSDPGADPEHRTRESVEKLFRFATVTLTAIFDPACLGRKNPKTGEQAVCTDRATVLLDAVVLKVHARKSVNDGIVSWYDFGALSEPGPDDRAAMTAVLKRFHSSVDFNVYLLPPGAHGRTAPEGLGCVCLEKTCEGRWPTRYVGGFDSLGNPFSCLSLIKLDGSWTPSPEDF